MEMCDFVVAAQVLSFLAVELSEVSRVRLGPVPCCSERKLFFFQKGKIQDP